MATLESSYRDHAHVARDESPTEMKTSKVAGTIPFPGSAPVGASRGEAEAGASESFRSAGGDSENPSPPRRMGSLLGAGLAARLGASRGPNFRYAAKSAGGGFVVSRHSAALEFKDAVTKMASERSQEKFDKRPWYILNPEAKGMGTWDAVTTTALIFTAVVTPVEVGFLPAPTSALDPLFCINRVVDSVFVLDMIAQFFLMVRIEKPMGLTMSVEWEYRLPQIALCYMKGWFALDLFSIAPMAFDIIPVINTADDGEQTSASPPRAAKALRVVRILRLIKLSRLIRSSRILKRWEVRNSLPTSVVTLIALMFAVLVIAHWIACLLSIQTTIDGEPEATCIPICGSNPGHADSYVGCYSQTFRAPCRDRVGDLWIL